MLDIPMEQMNPGPITSHYEYVVRPKLFAESTSTKQEVLRMAQELEGWCSEEKTLILVDLIMMTKPKTVVEIGVFGGKSLIPMAYAMKQNGVGQIYGVDPWKAAESVKGQLDIHADYWSKVDHTAILRGLLSKIIKFKLKKQIQLIQATSEDAPAIENIDILHIDGNHSVEKALIDLNKWVPLVRSGGIIIFDDLYWQNEAAPVDWLDTNCIKFAEFVESNRWGIWIKS